MTVHRSTAKLIFTHPLDFFFILLSGESPQRKGSCLFKRKAVGIPLQRGRIKEQRDSGSTYAVTYSTYCKLTHLWRSHALTAALGETHSGEMSVRGQILDCIHLHLWTDFQIRCARWSSIITTSHHHVICLKDFVKILLEQSIYKKCCNANSILHCITLAYSKKYVHI